MRALIIGAGNAGSNLAVKLCEERHDVVIIDRNRPALADLESQLDVLTVAGHGCSPAVLEEAEIRKAHLVVAVTSSDEVNILACTQAAAAGVRYKVARIAGADYLRENSIFSLAGAGVDLAVNPREECAKDILNNLTLPGSQEVIDLLGGRVLAVGAKVAAGSPLLKTTLEDFPRPDLLQTIRFIAVLRDNDLIIPRGDTSFSIGDEIYVVGQPAEIPAFLDWASPNRPHIDRIVIAGSGPVGMKLAASLETDRRPVVVIEPDEESANRCAAALNRATVLRSNPTSEETLAEVGITENTAFIASMESEEHNIIASLVARKQGAGMTVSQVTDPQYVPIINSLNTLDRAVSTHLSMINAILHFIRGRQIESASVMHMLPGELLEVVLTTRTPWTGKEIRTLRIPGGAIIATVLRSDTICPPTGDLRLQEGDRLVIFSNPRALKKLNAIFRR